MKNPKNAVQNQYEIVCYDEYFGGMRIRGWEVWAIFYFLNNTSSFFSEGIQLLILWNMNH
jgi:hypothetical protein